MKAILITGYHYNESIKYVEVKETAKSYMVNGTRFPKGFECEGFLGSVRDGRGPWATPMNLYAIDSKYAIRKIKKKSEDDFISKVKKSVSNTNLTYENARKIADILEDAQ
jgi:hypothetical protein